MPFSYNSCRYVSKKFLWKHHNDAVFCLPQNALPKALRTMLYLELHSGQKPHSGTLNETQDNRHWKLDKWEIEYMQCMTVVIYVCMRPVCEIENWSHLSCCLSSCLIIKRFQIHALCRPKMNFCHGSWKISINIQSSCRIIAQDFINLVGPFDNDGFNIVFQCHVTIFTFGFLADLFLFFNTSCSLLQLKMDWNLCKKVDNSIICIRPEEKAKVFYPWCNPGFDRQRWITHGLGVWYHLQCTAEIYVNWPLISK